MESLDLQEIPEQALILLDSAPVIYVLENHPKLASRFRPLFERHAAGHVRFAITTTTIAEVLTGALKSGDEALVRHYRSVFHSWLTVDVDRDIAESAARLRASLRLKLVDAVQVASAIAVNAFALATHDRDFSRVRSIRIIS